MVDARQTRARQSFRRTASEEVWIRDHAFPIDRELSAGERLDIRSEFEIPRDGPPSFSAPHNRITWLVTFAVSVPGCPDATETARLEVAPIRRVAAAQS